jgi:penicillin amidase
MKVQGRFPLKWEGQGKFLMDGKNPDFEWNGFIPNEHNPSTLNPERGFVSSANQHSTGPSYPYYIFDNSFEHYRNRRLNGILRDMKDITVDDMKRLQFDQYQLHASEALPVMVDLLLKANPNGFEGSTEKYFNQLINWNFNTFPNQEEPALFQTWWKHLYRFMWSKWEKEDFPVVLPNKYQTVKLMKNEPESILFDNPETETIEKAIDIVNNSFWEMVSEIQKMEIEKGGYEWADYKHTSILHLVPNFEAFSRKNIYTGGYSGVLNATSERNGASWRMVVEMGEKVEAFGIYPGGQSGNPGSKFYDNFIKIWANGDYIDFDLRKPIDDNGILFSTLFSN